MEPPVTGHVVTGFFEPSKVYRAVDPSELRDPNGMFTYIAHKTSALHRISIFCDGLGCPKHADRLLQCSCEENHSSGWKSGELAYDETYIICPYRLARYIEEGIVIVYHAIQTRTVLIKMLLEITTVGIRKNTKTGAANDYGTQPFVFHR